MSQLHAELSEQAYELGFESIEDAEQAGYGVDYENYKLVAPQDEAHQAWLKERAEVLEDLGALHEGLIERGYDALAEIAERAIKFIEKGEM
jgi:hypothetical protein